MTTRRWWDILSRKSASGGSYSILPITWVFPIRTRWWTGVMFTAYGSVASVVIFQAQDVLKLDNWARMNTPGTVGSNWRWRMRPGELNQGHADHLAWLVDTFGRF